MQMRFVLVSMALLASTTAWADYDAALEAQEKAQRDAAQRAQQARQREVQKMQNDAKAKADKETADSKRKTLGAAAQGKSDAEVNALYDAKIKKDMDSANRAAADAKRAMSSPQGEAAMKQTTGKTMKEMQNMTPAEAEALSKEMEKKYGVK